MKSSATSSSIKNKMTELKSIQELIDERAEIIPKGKRNKALSTDFEIITLKQVQQEIEKWIKQELTKSHITKSGFIMRDDVRERVDILKELHGGLK